MATLGKRLPYCTLSHTNSKPGICHHKLAKGWWN